MLHVKLLCVGKMKEKYFSDALAEYRKRLGHYCSFEETEVSETGNLAAEGEAVRARIPSGAFTVALCVEGEMLSSEALAGLLADRAVNGQSRVCFIVGGSEGLSPVIKEGADLCLSLSRLTFPHHLARVLLAEQIYRAFSINEGAKYHK